VRVDSRYILGFDKVTGEVESAILEVSVRLRMPLGQVHGRDCVQNIKTA
jgi:hypothetical protein